MVDQETRNELSKKARRDLMVISVVMVVAVLIELVTNIFQGLIDYFDRAGILDPGEFLVVPLVLAVGFAVFYYRQFHQLEDAVVAHKRARQQAEDARMESQEMQRLNQSLVGYGLDVLVKVNERGEIVQVNDDMEKATGRNGRNLKGLDVFSYFNDPDHVRRLFERAVESGAPVRDDNLEIRHRDGSETPVSTTIVVQQDADDRVLGGIVLCRA